MSDTRCKHCRFWEAGAIWGTCRRRSPQTNVPVHETVWPQTRASDWCGEFEALPTIAEGPVAPQSRSQTPGDLAALDLVRNFSPDHARRATVGALYREFAHTHPNTSLWNFLGHLQVLRDLGFIAQAKDDSNVFYALPPINGS